MPVPLLIPLAIRAVKEILPADEPAACVNCDEFKKPKPPVLDYKIKLGNNRILTPLEIPDFKELSSGSTKNKESIDFVVTCNKDEADQLRIEVFDGNTLLFSDTNTSGLLSGGDWQWDGYNASGILDTKVLKSKNLKVQITATKDSVTHVDEVTLSNNKAKEVDWVDAKIDRNAKRVELTVRPNFSDGGISGDSISGYTPKTFQQLEVLAKSGIEKYWTRDGGRTYSDQLGNHVVNSPIQTAKGIFAIKLLVDMNTDPKMSEKFSLIEITRKSKKLFEIISNDRSTSLGGFEKIIHEAGYWDNLGYLSYVDMDFEHTAAHEIGHLILSAYGNRTYSWNHKGTSSKYTQVANPNNPYPSGVNDLMKYHTGSRSVPSYWNKSVAHEDDVKGLLWITRVKFDD
jgi:hypothetical protein